MEEWIIKVQKECARKVFEECLESNESIAMMCDRLQCGEWELMSAFSELFEKDE